MGTQKDQEPVGIIPPGEYKVSLVKVEPVIMAHHFHLTTKYKYEIIEGEHKGRFLFFFKDSVEIATVSIIERHEMRHNIIREVKNLSEDEIAKRNAFKREVLEACQKYNIT